MSSNGRLADSELAPIPWAPSQRVAVGALANIIAWGEAFRARFGYYPAITDAYRTLARQTAMYKQMGYPRAAVPGTSNHGWGTALDIGSSINVYGTVAWRWMNTVGRTFGAVPLNEKNLAFEPWHWVFPIRAPHVVIPPAHPIKEDDDMRDAIISAYVEYLGRYPEPTGLADNILAATIGAGLSQVISGIANSAEAKSLTPAVLADRKSKLGPWPA